MRNGRNVLRFPTGANRGSVWRVLAGVLGALVLIARVATAEVREFIVSVPGIPGPYCAYGAEKRLLEIAGVEQVVILWKAEQIRVMVDEHSSLAAVDIENAMKKADYPYKFTVSTRP